VITATRSRVGVGAEDAHSKRSWKLILEAGHASKHYWRDVWRYRELIYFLAWRDIVVRYKQTVIGVAWALLRPAVGVLVFVIFRRLVGVTPGSVPEPLLVFTAILPWQFFAAALTESSSSLIGNANLISKVYFPRLIIPAAAVVTSLMDFAVTLGLLALLMLWYGVTPGWSLLTLPIFVLLAFGLALGVGVWLAALNVEYRDFRYIVPFVVQFGLFVSPIAFTLDSVPEKWRTLYEFYPMVGVIEGFRWSILGGQAPASEALVISAAVTAVAMYVGVWYFRRVERVFADVI
jgi:lipopolysaccharide transport system permease protein